jgi:hypothetical protein
MNKDTKSLVGLISVGVPWFDQEVANKNLAETRAWLEQFWSVVGPTSVVVDTPTLETAIRDFQTTQRPAVLIIQIGTFPDGEVPLRIAEQVRVPIIIHSLPEPEIDKRIAINSLCGANLTTFTLTEMGFPHKAIHGFVSDPQVQVQMAAYLRAGLVLAALKQKRIGLIGFRAPGFYPCVFDELLIRRTFGVGIDHIPLSEVVLELQKGIKNLRRLRTSRELKGEIYPGHRLIPSKNITQPLAMCWNAMGMVCLPSKIGRRSWDWKIQVVSGLVWAGCWMKDTCWHPKAMSTLP